MAVAFLSHERSDHGENRRDDQNYEDGVDDGGIKAKARGAEIFGGQGRHSGDLTAVGAELFGGLAWTALKERRGEGHVDQDQGKGEAAELIDVEREARQVEEHSFDELHLGRGGEKLGRHWDTHNLFKTRYKSASNSTDVVCSMMSGIYGKRASVSFLFRKNIHIDEFDFVESVRVKKISRLTAREMRPSEVAVC